MPISHSLDRWIMTDKKPRKTTEMTNRDGKSHKASNSKR